MLIHRSMLMLAMLCAPAAVRAQLSVPIVPPAPHRDIGYFELGGPGGLYSLNYERRLTAERVFRVGASSYDVTSLDGRQHQSTALIVGGERLIDVSQTPGFGGGSGKFVELGAALIAGTYRHAVYKVVQGDGAFLAISPSAGLRSDNVQGGFLFRITFTPIIGLVNGAGSALDGRTGMSAGISVGYVF